MLLQIIVRIQMKYVKFADDVYLVMEIWDVNRREVWE